MKKPERTDGYAPIEDYAVIGDGRALALVALDGAIDWLCLPDVDAPPVFSALLDDERGGRFTLRPRDDFEATRRYVDESNVLETLFTTSTGTVKVTEAFLTEGGALLPWAELVRKVQGIEGEVDLEWRFDVRPRWSSEQTKTFVKEGIGFVEWECDGFALQSYDCGDVKADGSVLHGRFTAHDQHSGLLAALYFDDQPYALPPRSELELRLDRTSAYWQSYTRGIPYEGPWRPAVRRSVLAQRLLTFPPTGAIAAAATTSLPERIGGDRNWDYRYSWVRDTSFALESLLAVRLSVECQRSLAWVIDAVRESDELQPMYTLHATSKLPREDIDFEGYRGSRPVRVGNDAQKQLQLGSYGDVIGAAYRFCAAGHMLDPQTSERVAELAGQICDLWQRDDSGIWEIETQPYTTSKIGCWAALDHAVDLAEQSRVPGDDSKTWRRTRDEIRDWVEANCWSDGHGAYTLYPGSRELDASVLLGARFGYFERGDERFLSTIDAIRRELGSGPFLYRTTGLKELEGCFLACSFWLVDALSRMGKLDDARALMDELIDAANGVGLYAEMIDPTTKGHLGNFPQALTHLSLILAAVSFMNAERDAV
ncbi:MAG TPA: glycoside hydrolase family 15 protein [Gaiellaceae bacterium]